MNDLNKLIIERRKELEGLLKKVERELKGLPEGRLRITHSPANQIAGAGPARYYWCIPGENRSGRYIPQSEQELICSLARKGYLQRIKKEIESQLHFLQKSIPDLSNRPLQNVYSELSDQRKLLFQPLVADDQTYIAQWQTEEYQKLQFEMNTAVIMTERGERVRSKSEKILADKFFHMGIPYHYEKPLKLKTGATKYPDFTLLKVSTRSNIYLEHFGLMDDPAYVNRNIRKLKEYIRSGIIPGKNLIITYETRSQPLDMAVVEMLIKTFLL